MSLRDYFSNNKIFTGTEKPTQGKFDVGDIIVNIGPNSAEEPMWICVEAGTPGVWELCSGVNEEEIADIVQANALSAIDYTDGVDIQIDGGEIGNMNKLQTTDKSSIVGAINELFQSANNGKELIANAIGEPLSPEDTFSAMSNDINGLLSTFKTNMMNNGVTVESNDKFKQLIDKLATLADNEGRGIQYAEGICDDVNLSSEGIINVNHNIPTHLNFTPNLIIIGPLNFTQIDTTNGYNINANYNNVFITNLNNTNFTGSGGYRSSFISNIKNISNDGFTLYYQGGYYSDAKITCKIDSDTHWYAIGVGEEDTTLRDSLASILTEEGVGVTEEDDMASLISKTDNQFNSLNTTITLLNNQVNSLTSELSGKVAPAGTAIAGDVLTGKTFINSTGQTITGTMANNGTKTITPKASAQTLGDGYYDKITINGDADLVAANIVSGKNIFGVAGTATVSSLGGKQFATGTSSTFDNSTTWTNYNGTKAEGVYTLSVTGLSFTPSTVIAYGDLGTPYGYVFSCLHSDFAICMPKIRSYYDSNWNVAQGRKYKKIQVTNGFKLPIERGSGTLTWVAFA